MKNNIKKCIKLISIFIITTIGIYGCSSDKVYENKAKEFKEKYWIQDIKGVKIGEFKDGYFTTTSGNEVMIVFTFFCPKGEKDLILENVESINIKDDLVANEGDFDIRDITDGENLKEYEAIEIEARCEILETGKIQNVELAFIDGSKVDFKIDIDIINMKNVTHAMKVKEIDSWGNVTVYNRNLNEKDNDVQEIDAITYKPYKDIEILEVLAGENFKTRVVNGKIDKDSMYRDSNGQSFSDYAFVEIVPKEDNFTNMILSPIYKVKVDGKIYNVSPVNCYTRFSYDDELVKKIKEKSIPIK